jgi:hypothetical protein
MGSEIIACLTSSATDAFRHESEFLKAYIHLNRTDSELRQFEQYPSEEVIVFRIMTPCGLIDSEQHFERTCYLYLQSRSIFYPEDGTIFYLEDGGK